MTGTGATRLTLGAAGLPAPTGNESLFSQALADGDFNGDGYGDLAISAPGDDGLRGMLVVIPGSASGLAASEAMAISPDTSGFRSPDSTYRFGLQLSAGDFDNDGAGDLMALETDEPMEDFSTRTFRGSATGLAVGRETLLRVDGFAAYAPLARAADFNGNGFVDTIVGF